MNHRLEYKACGNETCGECAMYALGYQRAMQEAQNERLPDVRRRGWDWICDICNKSMPNEETVRLHYRDAHRGMKVDDLVFAPRQDVVIRLAQEAADAMADAMDAVDAWSDAHTAYENAVSAEASAAGTVMYGAGVKE